MKTLFDYCRNSLRAAKNSDFGCGLPAALGIAVAACSSWMLAGSARATEETDARYPRIVGTLTGDLRVGDTTLKAGIRILADGTGNTRRLFVDDCTGPTKLLSITPRQLGRALARQTAELRQDKRWISIKHALQEREWVPTVVDQLGKVLTRFQTPADLGLKLLQRQGYLFVDIPERDQSHPTRARFSLGPGRPLGRIDYWPDRNRVTIFDAPGESLLSKAAFDEGLGQ